MWLTAACGAHLEYTSGGMQEIPAALLGFREANAAVRSARDGAPSKDTGAGAVSVHGSSASRGRSMAIASSAFAKCWPNALIISFGSLMSLPSTHNRSGMPAGRLPRPHLRTERNCLAKATGPCSLQSR